MAVLLCTILESCLLSWVRSKAAGEGTIAKDPFVLLVRSVAWKFLLKAFGSMDIISAGTAPGLSPQKDCSCSKRPRSKWSLAKLYTLIKCFIRARQNSAQRSFWGDLDFISHLSACWFSSACPQSLKQSRFSRFARVPSCNQMKFYSIQSSFITFQCLISD